MGRRRRAHGAGLGPGRRPTDRHDHVPRPHEVRREAGQVHARDRARRRDRERPGPAACGRAHLVDAARRLGRRSLRPGRRGERRPGRGGDAARRASDAGPGPLSAKTLEKLVGPAIYDIKYYWTEPVRDPGHPGASSAVPAGPRSRGSRSTSWTAPAATTCGTPCLAAGEEFGIRPIAPVRGAPDRGRHLQLRLGHDARATPRST